MLPSELEKLLKKNKKSKHKLNLGKGFVDYIAMESNNKFDRGIKFTGLPANDLLKLNEILFNSEFNKSLKKLGRKLSIEGKGWALVSYLVNGKPFVDFAEIFDYTKVAGVVTDIYLATKDNYMYQDANYDQLIRFVKTSNGIIKSEGIVTVDGWVEVTEPIVYTGELIPAWPMENNALGQPDIIKSMRQAIEEMDYYGNQIGIEYEKVKTQFINNLLFGATKDGEEWQEAQQNGKEYIHDVNSPDGKLQGSLAPLISGSNIGTQILQQIQYIEDKALKYSMQFRETMGGGTNKHNLEVSMENQAAFEYMMTKLEFRQDQLTRFFKLVGNQLGVNTEKLKVTLKVSELEQNKIDMMNATIRELKSKAIQAEGTGANQKAMANSVATTASVAPVATPVAPMGGQ